MTNEAKRIERLSRELDAGVGDDRLTTLCRIAGAFDRGLFEATRVRFDNVTWTPGHGAGCGHIRLTNGGGG